MPHENWRPAALEMRANAHRLKFMLIPADLVPLWQDQDKASIRFDVDASGRPQRIMPTAPAPTDDLRCAPRRDARFARHTHLSTPR